MFNFCIPAFESTGGAQHRYQCADCYCLHTVNNLHTWEHWSYWDQIDPKMQSTFEGPESGVGAVHKWSSDHKSVGHGSMTITENNPPNSIKTELRFEEMYPAHGGWNFAETPDGVKSTIYMEMQMPFMARIMG